MPEHCEHCREKSTPFVQPCPLEIRIYYKKNDERRSVHLVLGFSFPKRKTQHSVYKNAHLFSIQFTHCFDSLTPNNIPASQQEFLHGLVQPPTLTLGKWLKRSLKKCGSGIRIMSFSVKFFEAKNLHVMSAFTREQSNNTTPQSQPKLEWTWNTFWFFNIYSWFIPFAKLDQPSQEDELFWVSDFPKRCTRQLSYKIFKDPRIIATWHEGSNLGFWAKALKQMFRFKVNLQLIGDMA